MVDKAEESVDIKTENLDLTDPDAIPGGELGSRILFICGQVRLIHTHMFPSWVFDIF